MKIRILGCSGGIGGREQRTTALLVDHDVLIDCGTGVAELPLEALLRIDHVFLTHSHLDHIACLPMLVDTVGDMRERPLTIHATDATLEILRNHIFNWAIWPDFTEIPSETAPFMRYTTVRPGETVVLDGRRFTPTPANHTVPAVGYHLDSGRASLVFSGDTGPCPALWDYVNRIANLRHLLIETAFPDHEADLARVSLHLCPTLLAQELASLEREVEIFITHLKPGQAEQTMREIAALATGRTPAMLQNDQTFEL